MAGGSFWKVGTYMKNKTNNKKSIGEMSNSRMTWGFNSGTRVTKNKKGKGSYSRKNAKHE